MITFKKFTFVVSTLFLLQASEVKADRSDGMNSYILQAVKKIARERAGGGYDLNAFFTRNLSYGSDCCIPANKPPATMCVAAVTEVLVEAVNAYMKEKSDNSASTRVPMRMWSKSSRTDMRPYLFMYAETGSLGTANTLQRFGMGKEVPFEDLEPGDVINFNRTNRSGHAVIFLGYINSSYGDEERYSSNVAGFKYFSAQGKNAADAGMGFRWAFFGDTCPARDPSRPRDCGIIRSNKQRLLNVGYMLKPDLWTVEVALEELKKSTLQRAYSQMGVAVSNETLDSVLDPNNPNDSISGLSAKGYLADDVAPLSVVDFTGETVD